MFYQRRDMYRSLRLKSKKSQEQTNKSSLLFQVELEFAFISERVILGDFSQEV